MNLAECPYYRGTGTCTFGCSTYPLCLDLGPPTPFAPTPPPPPDGVCCGEHAPGVAGAPLVLACQLCPGSPTYWRDRCPRCLGYGWLGDESGPERCPVCARGEVAQ